MDILRKYKEGTLPERGKISIYNSGTCELFAIDDKRNSAYNLVYIGELVDNKIFDDEGHLKAVIEEE